jgi:type II secretory pathway component GspD/PulD (secretin)
VPEALAADKPQLVPIENVDAEQIAEVIRNVFKSQMTPARTTTGSSRSRRASTRLRVPQVAVDEGTNSLVVTADSPLLEEIIQLAEKLDAAAGENPARRIRIIPLEKTDASRVQRALEQILDTGSSRRR